MFFLASSDLFFRILDWSMEFLIAAGGLAFKIGGVLLCFEPWSDNGVGLGTGTLFPMDDPDSDS